MGCNERTILNDNCQTSNCTDNFLALTLLLYTAEVAMAIFQDEIAVVEKKMVIKKCFLLTAGFTTFHTLEPDN